MTAIQLHDFMSCEHILLEPDNLLLEFVNICIVMVVTDITVLGRKYIIFLNLEYRFSLVLFHQYLGYFNLI